ncbi:MAG: hypothetical protein KDA93_20755 [Planctomycetaceae bacterium]|nr:hypothetical protein [Planctomycetaceae bacterium]
MYYVGICPQCEEGLLGIRVCDDQTVVLCDECDALWLSPPEKDAPPATLRADPPCPSCGDPLWGEQAHWADRKQVESVGWWSHIAGEAGNRDESGGTRTPDRIRPLADSSDLESTESAE